MNRLIQLLVACSLHGFAAGQLSFTYGPEDAPLGCPVHLTLNNDTAQAVDWDPCGFAVVDATGAQVFTPPCAGPVTLQPGETYVHSWPQVDQTGAQVPAGTYFLGAPSGIAIQVGSASTAISALGAPKIGTARSFQLCSPQDAGAQYLLLASGSDAPPIVTCGGTIPLARDRLMRLSLSSPSVFQGFRGTLDGAGLSTSPTLAIPNDPVLAGRRIVLAFLIRDPGAACHIRRISTPFEFFIR